MVRDSNLEKKINDAADKSAPVSQDMNTAASDDMVMQDLPRNSKRIKANDKKALNKKNLPVTTLYVAGNTSTVSQVAGIIIGSPEFQRK